MTYIENNNNAGPQQLVDIRTFFPVVKLEKMTKTEIYKLTKHRDHQKNLRSFIKQKRYERRISNEFQSKKRRRSNIDDLHSKWLAVQQFLEYHTNTDEFTKYQQEIDFFKTKRRRLVDIDRYSVDKSETSSIYGGSSVSSENFRPRRSLASPVRFKFENFKSKREAAEKPSRKSLDLNISYNVEKIFNINLINNEIYCLVKWENYSEKCNTWEPLRNLRDCKDLVLEFVDDELENNLEEDYKAVLKTIEDEQKELIENYSKKSKLEITKEVLLKYDEFEFHCSQLLYMLVKDQTGQYNNFRKKFRHQLVLKHFLELEKDQNKAHDVIANEIMEKEMNVFRVTIENNVDYTVFESFNYTRENILPKDFEMSNSSLSKIGCKCKDSCDRMTKCCPKIMNGNFAYKEFNNGTRLRLLNSQMIFECNDNCECNMNCLNRLTQQPRKYPLTIFKTNNGRGWGLKAVNAIPRGTYIIEYTGEIIDQEESIRRGEKYDEIGKSYLFDLDFNEKSEAVYTIDAAHFGNLSRLINHSCEPNCRIWPVTNCNSNTSLYKLCYFTSRHVKAGEELTIDYSGGTIINDDVADDENEKEENGEIVDVAPLHNIAHKHRTLDVCRCGSSFCKGYIFV